MNSPQRNTTGVGQAVAPRVPTQVSSTMADLINAIETFDKSLQCHAIKIEPVLSPCKPTAVGQDAAPHEVICTVADQIRTACNRVNSLRITLESLTERAEA